MILWRDASTLILVWWRACRLVRAMSCSWRRFSTSAGSTTWTLWRRTRPSSKRWRYNTSSSSPFYISPVLHLERLIHLISISFHHLEPGESVRRSGPQRCHHTRPARQEDQGLWFQLGPHAGGPWRHRALFAVRTRPYGQYWEKVQVNYSNSDSLSLTLHRTLYSIFAVHYNSRCLVLSSHHNSRCLIFSLHHILPYPIIAMWRSLVRRIHHSSRSPRLSSLRFTSATGLFYHTLFPLHSFTFSLSLSLFLSFSLSHSLLSLSLSFFLSSPPTLLILLFISAIAKTSLEPSTVVTFALKLCRLFSSAVDHLHVKSVKGDLTSMFFTLVVDFLP